MKHYLIKHTVVRVIVSLTLLLLLHLSQIDYTINAKLQAMGWQGNPTLVIGSIVLFVWIAYLIIETVKLFKSKLKWAALSNVIIIISSLVGYSFINLLIALAKS